MVSQSLWDDIIFHSDAVLLYFFLRSHSICVKYRQNIHVIHVFYVIVYHFDALPLYIFLRMIIVIYMDMDIG